jgi:hypothetical protein
LSPPSFFGSLGSFLGRLVSISIVTCKGSNDCQYNFGRGAKVGSQIGKCTAASSLR